MAFGHIAYKDPWFKLGLGGFLGRCALWAAFVSAVAGLVYWAVTVMPAVAFLGVAVASVLTPYLWVGAAGLGALGLLLLLQLYPALSSKNLLEAGDIFKCVLAVVCLSPILAAGGALLPGMVPAFAKIGGGTVLAETLAAYVAPVLLALTVNGLLLGLGRRVFGKAPPIPHSHAGGSGKSSRKKSYHANVSNGPHARDNNYPSKVQTSGAPTAASNTSIVVKDQLEQKNPVEKGDSAAPTAASNTSIVVKNQLEQKNPVEKGDSAVHSNKSNGPIMSETAVDNDPLRAAFDGKSAKDLDNDALKTLLCNHNGATRLTYPRGACIKTQNTTGISLLMWAAGKPAKTQDEKKSAMEVFKKVLFLAPSDQFANRDSNLQTVWHYAILAFDIGRLKQLMNNVSALRAINMRNKDGCSPLLMLHIMRDGLQQKVKGNAKVQCQINQLGEMMLVLLESDDVDVLCLLGLNESAKLDEIKTKVGQCEDQDTKRLLKPMVDRARSADAFHGCFRRALQKQLRPTSSEVKHPAEGSDVKSDSGHNSASFAL